jgi:transcription initiation factor TFIIB
LVKELDLKMPVTDSIQCVARIASRIGIAEKTKRYATKVLKMAQENEVSAGKDPMGLAAAALYLSCVKNGEDKTQRDIAEDIAEAANVTEVTIRNRYKGLKESLEL